MPHHLPGRAGRPLPRVVFDDDVFVEEVRFALRDDRLSRHLRGHRTGIERNPAHQDKLSANQKSLPSKIRSPQIAPNYNNQVQLIAANLTIL